jgi:hypothetical protein
MHLAGFSEGTGYVVLGRAHRAAGPGYGKEDVTYSRPSG